MVWNHVIFPCLLKTLPLGKESLDRGEYSLEFYYNYTVFELNEAGCDARIGRQASTRTLLFDYLKHHIHIKFSLARAAIDVWMRCIWMAICLRQNFWDPRSIKHRGLFTAKWNELSCLDQAQSLRAQRRWMSRLLHATTHWTRGVIFIGLNWITKVRELFNNCEERTGKLSKREKVEIPSFNFFLIMAIKHAGACENDIVH